MYDWVLVPFVLPLERRPDFEAIGELLQPEAEAFGREGGSPGRSERKSSARGEEGRGGRGELLSRRPSSSPTIKKMTCHLAPAPPQSCSFET